MWKRPSTSPDGRRYIGIYGTPSSITTTTSSHIGTTRIAWFQPTPADKRLKAEDYAANKADFWSSIMTALVSPDDNGGLEQVSFALTGIRLLAAGEIAGLVIALEVDVLPAVELGASEDRIRIERAISEGRLLIGSNPSVQQVIDVLDRASFH